MTRSETLAVRSRRPRAEAKYAEILNTNRKLIRRTTAAVLISRLVLAAIPLQLKFTLDQLIAQEPLHAMGLEMGPVPLLVLAVVIGILVAVVRGLADYIFISTAAECGHSIVASLRIAMYEHLLRLPTSYVDRRGSGKILLRFIGDSDALRSWVSRRAPAVRADRVVLGMLVVVMLIVDWRLTLVTLLPVPLVWYLARRMAPRICGMTRDARREQAGLTGRLGASLERIGQAKWLDRDRRNRRAVRDAARTVAAANIQRDRYGAVLHGAGQFLAFISVPILLATGIMLAWNDTISLGTCLAFLWLAAHAAVTLHRLNAAVVLQQKAEVSRDRILRLLERSAERGRSSHLPELRAEGRSLRFEDVVVQEARPTVPFASASPRSFELHGPGICALGQSSEVSTAARVVLGLKKVCRGRVFLDNQAIAETSVESVRREVGWIVENPLVFEGTMRENVRAACPCMEEHLLDERISSILGGEYRSWLESETTWSGAELSRDSRLAISILRAAVTRPKFVFVEPTLISDHMLELLTRAVESLRDSAMVVASPELVTRMKELLQRSRPIDCGSSIELSQG